MRCLLALSLFIATPALSQQTIYVDGTRFPQGDGRSWATAYRSLADALNVATSGDVLWVADATYTPRLSGGPEATFDVPPGVTLLGGFEGNETDIRQRNPIANRTVLDGNNSLYTVVTITGTFPDSSDPVTIDGFTIGNAVANGPNVNTPEQDGAGIYCENNDLVLRNIRFQNLSATRGSGVFLRRLAGQAELTIESTEFIGLDGGACIGGAPSRLVVSDSTARNNQASFIDIGTNANGVEIVQCVIEDNESINPPMDIGFGDMLIDRCIIRNNEARSAAAVRTGGSGDKIIRGSLIAANTAPFAISAAVVLNSTPSALIENTLFIGNACQGAGGVISASGNTQVEIINVTMFGNEVNQDFGAAIVAQDDASVTLRNSIAFGNIANSTLQDERVEILVEDNATVQAFRSIIAHLGQGAAPTILSVGSFSSDPMLVDPDGPDNTFGTEDDNPKPAEGSPLIDAGDNTALVHIPSLDAIGNPRFQDDTDTADTGINNGQNGVIDIGACEFNPCPADINGDGNLSPTDFTAWIGAFNANAPQCDQNNDGVCTPTDFSAWISNYNAGC